MSNKKIKIGVDLDGVIIGKPPLVPKKFLEYLFKGKRKNSRLHYRFPKSKLEQKIRILSHYWFLRPPLKKNLDQIKKLLKNKKYEVFFVSSRYSFLKNKTKQWFAKTACLLIKMFI